MLFTIEYDKFFGRLSIHNAHMHVSIYLKEIVK